MKTISLMALLLISSSLFASADNVITQNREFEIISESVGNGLYSISAIDGYESQEESLEIFTVEEIKELSNKMVKNSKTKVYLYGAGLAVGAILTGGSLVYGITVGYAAGGLMAAKFGSMAYNEYRIMKEGYGYISNGITTKTDEAIIINKSLITTLIKNLRDLKASL